MRKISFGESVEKLGFGLAVVTHYEELSKEFFEKLTFDEWVWVYNQSLSGSDLQKLALKKISEISKKIDELIPIHKNVLSD